MWTILLFVTLGLAGGCLSIRIWTPISNFLCFLMPFLYACLFAIVGLIIALILPNGGRHQVSTQKIGLMPINNNCYIFQIKRDNSKYYYGLIEKEKKISPYYIDDSTYRNRKEAKDDGAYIIRDHFVAKRTWRKISDWGWGIDTIGRADTLYLPKSTVILTEE